MYQNNVVLIAKLDISQAMLNRFGNKLFAMSSSDNILFDIHDKLNPTCVSRFNLVKSKVSYSSSLLGIVNNKAFFSIGYNSIQVVDFSNESEPVDIGCLNDILIGGKWLFLSENYIITNTKTPVIYQINSSLHMSVVYKFEYEIYDFVLINNILICATLIDGIKVYDLSCPSSPALISSLRLNAARLVAKDSKYILAEGLDDNIYTIDVSDSTHITIAAKMKIPGSIASNSLLCRDNLLFVRFKRRTTGDTTLAFNLSDIINPKLIFEFSSPNTPLYTADNNLLVFMGIKDWDGISPPSNCTTSLYKVFKIESDTVQHLSDLEMEGIWFSSIALFDNVIYIARPDAILVYRVDC